MICSAFRGIYGPVVLGSGFSTSAALARPAPLPARCGVGRGEGSIRRLWFGTVLWIQAELVSKRYDVRVL